MNPTPYVNFMPVEMLMFGERSMLAAFQARPPDYVVLISKDTSEYGYRTFGRDYGTNLYAWIVARYEHFGQIGPPPLQEGGFGIEVLRRRPPVLRAREP